METEIYCPESLVEAIRYFENPDNCHNFMVSMRWPNGVKCPRCGGEAGKLVVIKKNRKGDLLPIPRRVWNCKNRDCKPRQFSAKTLTIFEDSALGLDKWLTAV